MQNVGCRLSAGGNHNVVKAFCLDCRACGGGVVLIAQQRRAGLRSSRLSQPLLLLFGELWSLKRWCLRSDPAPRILLEAEGVVLVRPPPVKFTGVSGSRL